MAQNSSDTSDMPEPDPSQSQTTELIARLESLEDPLDLNILEDLSLYFKLNGSNPVSLIKLYKECIISLEKEWKPFIGTLAFTLSQGSVVACEYLMVGYSECLKVIRARDIPTILSNISNIHDKVQGEHEVRMSADHEICAKQQQLWREQAEEQATQISLLSKAVTDLLHTVEINLLKLIPNDSAAIADEIASTNFSSPPALNQFIWKDGKSYKSSMGILTANRDETIAINITSPEFTGINILRTIRIKPEVWELVLNRDLDQLAAYLTINSGKFKGFNQKDISDQIDIINDLTSQVPVNINQWINASVISEKPKCFFHCKIESDFKIRIQGLLPLCNLEELIQNICLMVIINLERSLDLSKSAMPFLWSSIYKNCSKFTKTNKIHEDFCDMAVCNLIHNAFSEGLCEEKPISPQSVSGERTWQLTDNCERYVTVLFSYKLQYSTLPTTERETLECRRFCVMRAPSTNDMVKLLKVESQIRNLKTADQSEFLRPLLYMKRDDLERARKRKKLA